MWVAGIGPVPFVWLPAGTSLPSGGVAPVPVAQNLQGGTVGVSYAETISAVDGTPSYTFAITSGSLPPGTSLNASSGSISGTPTTSGTYAFTVSVTDARNISGSRSFSITVDNPSSSGGGASNYGFVA